MIAARLVSRGHKVFLPFGGGSRYDMVAEIEGSLTRIQVKTGKLSADGGHVAFNTCSNNRGYGRKSYHDEADLIAVYSPELDRYFWVPVELTGVSQMKLRLAPTKNRQSESVNMATDFEF